MPGDSKKSEDGPSNVIEDFREYHTENTVHFVVTMTSEQMKAAEKAGLEKTFKIKTSISTQNMMLFDSVGKIARYESALDILKEFCTIRRGIYDKRKDYLVSKLRREKEILSNKARFILMVVNEELELRKKKKDVLLKELQKLKFTPMSELNAIMKGKDNRKHKGDKKDDDAQEDAGNEEAEADKSDYDYLLGMALWSLTFEKVEEIKKQLRAKEEELKIMQKKTIETFWDEDLVALSAALDEMDAQEEAEAAAAQEYADGRRKKMGGRAPKVPIVAAKKRPKEDKAFSQPLVTDAGNNLAIQKAISGQGEGGPTRYSAADIPLEDQQAVNRDPDVMQRPAKVPRQRRATQAKGDDDVVEVKAPEPAPEESSGASLLQRMLSQRKMAIPEPRTSSSHGSLSTGADFFFGSSASIFSSGLPEPTSGASLDLTQDAADEPSVDASTKSGGRGRGRGKAKEDGDEPAKKVPRRKKKGVDDDDESE
jgi:DNA topoisomerase-2